MAVNFSNDSGHGGWPSKSPDGAKIAFEVVRESE